MLTVGLPSFTLTVDHRHQPIIFPMFHHEPPVTRTPSTSKIRQAPGLPGPLAALRLDPSGAAGLPLSPQRPGTCSASA